MAPYSGLVAAAARAKEGRASRIGFDNSSSAWIRSSSACTSPTAVDDMQSDLAAGAGLLRRDFLVVAGVRVDDAAAAGRHPLEAALVERLQVDEDRPGSGDVLRFDQLLAAAKLTGGDVILNRGDDRLF